MSLKIGSAQEGARNRGAVRRAKLYYIREEVGRAALAIEHAGYGTPVHRLALAQLGPCRVHRLSYAGVGA